MAEYKIVNAEQLENDMTSVANKIRSKSNTSDAMSWPDGYISAIDMIGGGEYSGDEDGMLDGSFTGDYVNGRITKLRAYALAYCTATKIKLGTLRRGGYACFANANAVRIELPVMDNGTQTSMFNSCKSLEAVDCGITNVIVNTCFTKCAKLKVVILRRSSVTMLSDVAGFNGTLFASGGTGGKILCPRALVEQYPTASNWNTLYGYGTCEFLALEDYTVDGTTTGEVDWDKIETELLTQLEFLPETNQRSLTMQDRCVCCGELVPEGRMVCPNCESKYK